MDHLPAIETFSLCRAFGSFRAVTDLGLKVPKGSVYGFLGANGAGKTTTIRMLMGILPATSGEVAIGGARGRKVTLQQRRTLSYVSQEQYFYPWMTGWNLGKFVSGFYQNWSDVEFANLMDLFSIPPKRRVDELSGGMRTKLALALSLASRPEILILDEPTTGLDPIARREFMDLVLKCAKEECRTVFFSSHLVTEVERFADHVGMLDHGQLRFQGSLEEVYEKIRRVTFSEGSEPLPISNDFEVWQAGETSGRATTQIVQAHDAKWWESNYRASEYQVERLSLEDAFLASVSRSPEQ